MATAPRSELTIRLDTFIDASPERVWGILSTPEGMRRWQGAQQYEPKAGGKIVFHLGATGQPASGEEVEYISNGEVVVFDPPRKLAYTWRQHSVRTGETWPAETLVTLSLEPEGGGTRVRVEHGGFEHLPQGSAQQAFDDYRMGWELHDDLGKLKRLAEARD